MACVAHRAVQKTCRSLRERLPSTLLDAKILVSRTSTYLPRLQSAWTVATRGLMFRNMNWAGFPKARPQAVLQFEKFPFILAGTKFLRFFACGCTRGVAPRPFLRAFLFLIVAEFEAGQEGKKNGILPLPCPRGRTNRNRLGGGRPSPGLSGPFSICPAYLAGDP